MTYTGGYFGGGNGARGFVNYFGAVTKGIERLYILKGGSGCGKNSLMRKVVAEAERRGEAAERVYCASDPNSLDGVILRERGVGVLDGTAPHELAPRIPGVMDNLVDLGEYWDTAALRKHSNEIKALYGLKKECYSRAYALLAAAGKLRAGRQRLLGDAVLYGKLSAAVRRTAEKLCKGGKGGVQLRPRTAFGGTGLTVAPNYGGRLWAIRDPYDLKGVYLRQLLAACFEQGGGVTLSPDATDPKSIEALRIDAAGALFAADDTAEAEHVVNMERFADKNAIAAHRQKLRFLAKAEARLKAAAAESMAEARRHHLSLEALYIPTMDFGRVDARTEKVITEIFA